MFFGYDMYTRVGRTSSPKKLIEGSGCFSAYFPKSPSLVFTFFVVGSLVCIILVGL